MIAKNLNTARVLGVLCAICSVATVNANTDLIAPPDVHVVDEFGVNLISGQVEASLNTVSIGGDLGLTHDISLFTNHFTNPGMHPFRDSYSGNVKKVFLGEDVFLTRETRYYDGNLYIMRVFGPVGSQDFLVKTPGGALIPNPSSQTSFVYEPIGDQRHTLKDEIVNGNNYLVWTLPDGTRLLYPRSSGSSASQEASLEKVIYPNGFSYTVSYDSSVKTNTGFELWYDHEAASPLASQQQSMLSSVQYRDTIPNYGLWNLTKHVVGINRAQSDCSGEECLNEGWPTATFNWPTGMPVSIYLGDPNTRETVFSVEAADGGVTEFTYKAQDVCMQDPNDSSTLQTDCIASAGQQRWSPRLVGVKSAGSLSKALTYTYGNYGSMGFYGDGRSSYTVWQLDEFSGAIRDAKYIDRAITYQGTGWELGHPKSYIDSSQIDYQQIGGKNIAIIDGKIPGKVQKVYLQKKGWFIYELSYRNNIVETQPINGAVKHYNYNDWGNLEGVTVKSCGRMAEVYNRQAANCTEIGEIVAVYPPTSTCATDPKRCNKPTSVTDLNGNTTNYTYHQASGQVATVTGPAVNGVRPKTTYSYEQKYAYFYEAGGSIQKADDPIWMLTKEWYCRSSAASGENCAGGNLDKVTTEYYYGPEQAGVANNLLLRGTKVTAEGNSGALETRVTCYEYDKYGNRVGEVRPKANTGFESCTQ